MNTKIMLIALFSIIVIAGILFVNNQVSSSNLLSRSCEELAVQIGNMIIEANYCDVDSDCLISGEALRRCECYNFVNKNADMGPIVSKIEEFSNKCEPDPLDFTCEQCYTIQPDDKLFCKENKCFLVSCYSLPLYVTKFYKYYKQVEIINDSCQPNFTFKTPASYSKFNLSYNSYDFSYSLPEDETIEDFDNIIREQIVLVESCPDFKLYYELIIDDGEEPKYLTGFRSKFLTNNECRNYSTEIRFIKINIIINTFLDSGKLGSYVACSRDRDIAGFGASDFTYKNISVDVSCDGINERLLIIIENDDFIEAYFLNHKNIPYRQIYPEDISIRDRTTVWENQDIIEKLANLI